MKRKVYKKYMNELYKSIIVAYNGDDETWASMRVHQKGIKGKRFKKIINNRIIHDAIIEGGFYNIPNPPMSEAKTYEFDGWPLERIEFVNPNKFYCIYLLQSNPEDWGIALDFSDKSMIQVRRMDKLPFRKDVHIEKFYPRWTNQIYVDNRNRYNYKKM